MVAIPLRTRFRGLEVRELMVFEGPNGWSEWAAFAEYGDEEASRWLEAAIEWGFSDLPQPVRDSVPVNAILPAVSPAEVEKVLNRAGAFKTLKIKVAEKVEGLEVDLERILMAHKIRPDCRLRLDANGGFDVETALRLLHELAEKNIQIQYFEQPVLTIGELAELKIAIKNAGLKVPIAADESVRLSSDPLAVELAGAADILVLKSAPLGGIRAALGIAAESKLRVVPSSAMQSSVGLAAELHFAATLPSLDFDAGLGTGFLFAGDLVKDPLRPEGGVLEVRRPEINLSSLDTLRAEDHRYDWWVDRLKRCSRILGLQS